MNNSSEATEEYFNYEASGRGSYDKQGHTGVLARVYLHSDKIKLTHDEIVARRGTELERTKYVHELCSRARTRFQMYKLASLPIIVSVRILQMQLKQIATLAEQVYLTYFGNCSASQA